ncbi:SLC13 family permease [Cognatiluteimonas telluris]|uniref:SLC13 family permease n=1 Tax=Cognatiluteimonas telluris TaxID=1104775 RepID=UPI00140798FE|nr:SLC13 family permease [Lysobacter telluris]
MTAFHAAHLATWTVAASAVTGVILRPWRMHEAVWAVAGAAALVLAGLVSWRNAGIAVGRGLDVYLFLAGMMLLSELARREGLFDFLAAHAVELAAGSPRRLFLLTYAIGTLVTVFMSNDATAVVLTPAVYAVARRAKADALPYLFACAFIANAASFVLPISNPANLVIFGTHMPPLLQWLGQFTLPSLLAVVATFAMHRRLEHGHLCRPIDSGIEIPTLSRSGALTGYGIALVAIALLLASFHGVALGPPTLLATSVVAAVVLFAKREAPWATLRHVSWGVLPLVAGLFVLVQGLQQTGAVSGLARLLQSAADASTAAAAWGAGIGLALACNLVNNLPMGLVAGTAVNATQVDPVVRGAIAIAIDLGPNLSVTGSLATILWLTAIRREGEDVTAWQFLRRGALVMPLALLAALAGLWLQAG